ncbi:MAG: DNA/RNA non-specific endonuclease, partial [Spirochaetales bacterium]|nr:DNA/RNA non-specific endonuclease [Spirochaetales bacterium]
MNKKETSFQLEALEPRLLLSGDGYAGNLAVASPLVDNFNAVLEVEVQKTVTLSLNDDLSYQSESGLSDLFFDTDSMTLKADPEHTSLLLLLDNADNRILASIDIHDTGSIVMRGAGEEGNLFSIDLTDIHDNVDIYCRGSEASFDRLMLNGSAGFDCLCEAAGGGSELIRLTNHEAEINVHYDNIETVIWRDCGSVEHAESESGIRVKTLNAPHGPPETIGYRTTDQNYIYTLRVNPSDPANLQLWDDANGIEISSWTPGEIYRLSIYGSTSADDTLTIDASSPFWLEGGVFFHGGDAWFDSLNFKGNENLNFCHTPIGKTSSTTIISSGTKEMVVDATGLEPTTFDGRSFTFNTNSTKTFENEAFPPVPGEDHIIISKISETTCRIRGTSGGEVFEYVDLTNVEELIINLGDNDTLSHNRDSILIEAGALDAGGIKEMEIITRGDSVDFGFDYAVFENTSTQVTNDGSRKRLTVGTTAIWGEGIELYVTVPFLSRSVESETESALQIGTESTLNLHYYIDGISPVLGDSFDLFNYTSISGSFKFVFLYLDGELTAYNTRLEFVPGLEFFPRIEGKYLCLDVGVNHLFLGNPITTPVNNSYNYLLEKGQYAVSFNNNIMSPNFVAWQLNDRWLNDLVDYKRPEFTEDLTLSLLSSFAFNLDTGETYQSPDGSLIRFDRGHFTPLKDRHISEAFADATFKMTNIVPMYNYLNQQTWEYLEEYCRELAGYYGGTRTLYIYSGAYGELENDTNTFSGDTITFERDLASGSTKNVTAPEKLWKVIFLVDNDVTSMADINAENTSAVAFEFYNERVANDCGEKTTEIEKSGNPVSIISVRELENRLNAYYGSSLAYDFLNNANIDQAQEDAIEGENYPVEIFYGNDVDHILKIKYKSPDGREIGADAISGDYTLNRDYTLLVDLGSLSSFDRLNVTGAVTLNGRLEVRQRNNYTPRVGDYFPIITSTVGITENYSAKQKPIIVDDLILETILDVDTKTLYLFARPLVDFTWEMEERYGVDNNGDGRIDIPNHYDYVNPENGYKVTFHADVATNLAKKPTSYHFTITQNGEPVAQSAEGSQSSQSFHLAQGEYDVRVYVGYDTGTPTIIETKINVRDILIVSVGDSYASGQGNPDVPGVDTSEFTTENLDALWNWSDIDDPELKQQIANIKYFGTKGLWADAGDQYGSLEERIQMELWHLKAHRSAYAASSQLAMEIERSDPHTSVTFVFLATSGATIDQGLLDKASGDKNEYLGDPEFYPEEWHPAQIDMIDEIVGERKIDSLIIGIGGNDIGFERVAITLLALLNLGVDDIPIAQLIAGRNDALKKLQTAVNTGTQEDWEAVKSSALLTKLALIDTSPLRGLQGLKEGYQEVATAIENLKSGRPLNIYVTEYPDVTTYNEYIDEATMTEIVQFCRHGLNLLNPEILGIKLPSLEIDEKETEWIRLNFIEPLNNAIRDAAASHGWTYIDGISEACATHGFESHDGMGGAVPVPYTESWQPDANELEILGRDNLSWLRNPEDAALMQSANFSVLRICIDFLKTLSEDVIDEIINGTIHVQDKIVEFVGDVLIFLPRGLRNDILGKLDDFLDSISSHIIDFLNNAKTDINNAVDTLYNALEGSGINEALEPLYAFVRKFVTGGTAHPNRFAHESIAQQMYGYISQDLFGNGITNYFPAYDYPLFKFTNKAVTGEDISEPFKDDTVKLYYFEGTKGDVVSFDLRAVDVFLPWMTVYDPSGDEMDLDAETITLSESGLYTIKIDADISAESKEDRKRYELQIGMSVKNFEGLWGDIFPIDLDWSPGYSAGFSINTISKNERTLILDYDPELKCTRLLDYDYSYGITEVGTIYWPERFTVNDTNNLELYQKIETYELIDITNQEYLPDFQSSGLLYFSPDIPIGNITIDFSVNVAGVNESRQAVINWQGGYSIEGGNAPDLPSRLLLQVKPNYRIVNGDIDGDNIDEIVICNPDITPAPVDNIYVFKRTESGYTKLTSFEADVAEADTILIGDLINDSKKEIIIQRKDGDGKTGDVDVYEYDSSANTFMGKKNISIRDHITGDPLVTGDLCVGNVDLVIDTNKDKLVWLDVLNNSVFIYKNFNVQSGDNYTITFDTIEKDLEYTTGVFGLGDIDGNGYAELVVVEPVNDGHSNGSGKMYIYNYIDCLPFYISSSQTIELEVYDAQFEQGDILKVCDIDEDHKDEIVFINKNGNTNLTGFDYNKDDSSSIRSLYNDIKMHIDPPVNKDNIIITSVPDVLSALTIARAQKLINIQGLKIPITSTIAVNGLLDADTRAAIEIIQKDHCYKKKSWIKENGELDAHVITWLLHGSESSLDWELAIETNYTNTGNNIAANDVANTDMDFVHGSPVSLNSLINPLGAIQEGIINPITGLFENETVPSIHTVTEQLKKMLIFSDPSSESGFVFYIDPLSVTGVDTETEQSIGFTISASKKVLDIYTDLGEAAKSLGIDLNADSNIEVDVEIILDTAFGFRNGEFFIRINKIELYAQIDASITDVSIDLGILEARMDEGFFNFAAGIRIDFADTDGDGVLTESELENYDIDNLSVTLLDNSIYSIIPIELIADGASGEFTLSITCDNVFGGGTPDITASGSATLDELVLGDVLTINNLTFSFEDNGNILKLEADNARIGFPDVLEATFSDAADDTDTVAISGVYNLIENKFSLTADVFDFLIPDLLTVNATGIAVYFDPNAPEGQELLTMDSLTAKIIPIDNVSLNLDDLTIYNNGFSLGQGSIIIEEFGFGEFFTMDELVLSVTGLSYMEGSPLTGVLGLATTMASLDIGGVLSGTVNDTGDEDIMALEGTYDIETGKFSLDLDSIFFEIEGVLSATAMDVEVSYDPTGPETQEILSISDLTVDIIPLEGVTIVLSSLIVRQNGFSLGSGEIIIASYNLGGVLDITNLVFSVTGLDYTAGNPLTGTFGLSAEEAEVTVGSLTGDVTGLEGYFDLETKAIWLSIAGLTLDMEGVFSAEAAGIDFNYDPSGPAEQVVFSFDDFTLEIIPLEGAEVTITNLSIRKNGFSMGTGMATLDVFKLGEIITIHEPALSVTGLDYTVGEAMTGSFGLSALSGSLVLGSLTATISDGNGDGVGIGGIYDLSSGQFSLDIDTLVFTMPDVFNLTAQGVHCAYNAHAPPLENAFDLSVTTLHGVILPLNETEITVNNLTIWDTGFSIESGSVTVASFSIGTFLEINDLAITLNGLSYEADTDELTGTFGLAAGSATLFPGSSFTASITDDPADPDDYGITGTYNVETKAFAFTIDRFFLAVSDIISVTATGIAIGYDPADDNPAQELVRITEGTVDVPQFSVQGSVEGIVIRKNGFDFGSFTLTYTDPDPITLGPLSIANPGVTVGGFSVTYGGDVTFAGTITVSAGAVEIFPDSTVFSASAENVAASLDFSDPDDLKFVFTAGSLSFTIGDYVEFTTRNILINPDAGAEEDVFSVGEITVSVPQLGISGSGGNFSIQGDGDFVPGENFFVSLSFDEGTSGSLAWPEWLPIQITTLGIQWPDAAADLSDFYIILSARVVSINGMPFEFEGLIEGVKIDVQKLLNGEFPIIDIEAAGVTVRGNLFGGEVNATLIVGVLKLDGTGEIIPAGNPQNIEAAESVLYAGIEGGFSFAGIGGFTIRVGLCEYGPLSVHLSAAVPIVIVPPYGITITNFRAGITFGQTLPDITDPEELRDPAFEPALELSPEQWLQQMKEQIKDLVQGMANEGLGAWEALTQNMIIEGGATLYCQYLSEQTFSADIDIKISTDGKFLINARANFFDGAVTTTMKMYADFGNIDSGEFTILFLMDIPDQTQILTVKGSLQMFFSRSDGGEVTEATPADQFEIRITGGVELTVIPPDLVKAVIEGEVSLVFGDGYFTMDVNGSLAIQPLGTIASMAGRLVVDNTGGGCDVWGVLKVETNFSFLEQIGIYLDAEVLIWLNTADVTKTETIELPGIGERTYELPANSFSIQALGYLIVKIDDTEWFRMQGQFAMEIDETGLRVFANAN